MTLPGDDETLPFDDERGPDARFWQIDSVADGMLVSAVLRQRFPDTWRILSSCLEAADPHEIVYPGNPDEYSDVVSEALLLLADVNADLTKVERARLSAVLTDALARCFGESPERGRVEMIADLVLAAVADACD